MSAPASPPLSVWETPGLDSGAKLAWLGLRSFATFGDEGEVFVWPCRASLARRIGQKPETVKKMVGRLTRSGIITRAKRFVDGALREGWVVQAGDPVTQGEPVTRGTHAPGAGTTLPMPGEPVTQARGTHAPHTLQDQSNYQSSEGDAPAPATHESENHAHGQDTHTRSPEAQPRSPAVGEVADRDGSRAGGTRAAPGQVRGDAGQAVPLTPEAANEHLGPKLAAHRASVAHRDVKPSNRVQLTKAVDGAVRDGRMGTQLEAVVWVNCLLETLDDFGIGESEHAATVARVLAAWNSGDRSRPPKSQLWYRKHRDWQREAMGLGQVVKRKGDNMSGGLVPVVSTRPNGYETRAACKARMALEAEQGAA